MILILPYEIKQAIDKKLDEVLERFPDALKDRDIYFNQILAYYDEYGEIPDFTLD